jgi:hypothetical protein
MGWTEWVLGIAGSVIVLSIMYMGKVLNDLPERFMPRPQINQRFEALEARLHEDMVSQERRTDKQLDKLDAKLDQIIDKLDGKADK